MTEQKLSDPPELVALCREGEGREDEDGEEEVEEVVGWAMVFANRVVGYIPDSTGAWNSTYSFSSLDSAALILGYSGIYPVTDLATLPPAPR